MTNNEVTSHNSSLSHSIKQILYSPASNDSLVRKELNPHLSPYKSIYEIANELQMTIQEWVQLDPQLAVRQAEYSCASWQELLTTAAIKGGVDMTDEKGVTNTYELSKNQTKLIEVRVNEARKQLDTVNEIVISLYKEGDKRKDALERAMYRRALQGDSRLAIYLHDRVEGRPAESKIIETDYDYTYAVYAIIKSLFDKQLEVLNSGNGIKLICCTRRAGKTLLLVAILMIECLRNKNITCMYIGETMELSESLVNTAAEELIDRCQLKDKKGRRLDWKHFDNGSRILIRGLSNTKDPDQIRGFKARVIVIDEYFHLKSELLEYMQTQVLEPMQMDYADNYMFVCAGTPPKIKGTYGEKMWKESRVPHFSWSWEDNPHPVSLELRREFVEQKLKEKGLDWTSPYARREYRAEWAYDEDLLLYPDYYTYDPKESVPNIKATHVLFGIDYGVGDNDTIWGAIWNDSEHRGYVFWEDKFNRLTIKDSSTSQLEYLCSRVKQAWETAFDFFPHLSKKEANKRIWWDADDSDQHLTNYMNTKLVYTYQDEQNNTIKLSLGIRNAHKTDKIIMFDNIRDLLRSGGLLLIKDGKTEQEVQSTILKRGPNGEIYPEVDEKAFHPDLLPAMRYALWNVIGIK